MMKRPRLHPPRVAVVLLLAAPLAMSCAPDGDSVVLVQVNAAGPLPDLFQLHATLSNGDRSDSAVFPDLAAAAGHPLKIPTDFSITLPRTLSGPLDIALDGLDLTGHVAANGAARTTISPSRKTEVSIPLAAGPSLCGNSRIDSGEECDDGDRVSNGSCDFMCRRIVSGAGGGNGAGGATGVGGVSGTGGGAVTGSGGSNGGTGGTIGTGGRGVGGAIGTGGTTGTGGRGVGGMGVGGTGAGGSGGTCSLELLSNFYFDNAGAGWTPFSSLNQTLILSQTDPETRGVVPASPPNLAVLGRNLLPGGTESLSQTVQVPAAANFLIFLGSYKVVVDPADAGAICLNCNQGVVELISNGVATQVFSWTNNNATSGTNMGAFSTMIDAIPYRNLTVIYRFRVTPTASPPTRYFFDNPSLKVDRCQ